MAFALASWLCCALGLIFSRSAGHQSVPRQFHLERPSFHHPQLKLFFGDDPAELKCHKGTWLDRIFLVDSTWKIWFTLIYNIFVVAIPQESSQKKQKGTMFMSHCIAWNTEKLGPHRVLGPSQVPLSKNEVWVGLRQSLRTSPCHQGSNAFRHPTLHVLQACLGHSHLAPGLMFPW